MEQTSPPIAEKVNTPTSPSLSSLPPAVAEPPAASDDADSSSPEDSATKRSSNSSRPHPVRHRYEVDFLLSLRNLPASTKVLEIPSQLNNTVRWNNSNNQHAKQRPAQSDSASNNVFNIKTANIGRFGGGSASSSEDMPYIAYQPPVDSGSLLGLPTNLRGVVEREGASKNGEKGAVPVPTNIEFEENGDQEHADQVAPPPEGGEASGAGPFAARSMAASRSNVTLPPQTPLGPPPGVDSSIIFLSKVSKMVDEQQQPPPPPPRQSPMAANAAPYAWLNAADRGASPGGGGLPPTRQHSYAYAQGQRIMAGGDIGGYTPDRPPNSHYYSGAEAQWDADPWDSPVDGVDVNDIFTLGDIRQAEHAIETQGISAESYANFRTRKILSDQAERRRPPIDFKRSGTNTFSGDLFFEENPRLPLGGEGRLPEMPSRFLPLFNGNNQQTPNLDVRPGLTPRVPMNTRDIQNQAVAAIQSLPYAQQEQLAANWVAQQAEKSAADKALMRDHLLKLLKSKQGVTQGGQQISPPPVDPTYDPTYNNKPMHYMRNACDPPRPPGMTFSKPLNPAAPNFAPSGLFAQPIPTDAHNPKRPGNRAPILPQPQPSPITPDYRHMSGSMPYETSPSHHMMPPHYGNGPKPAWNGGRPHGMQVDEYNSASAPPQQSAAQRSQPNPLASNEFAEIFQKLLIRQKQPQQGQQPMSEQTQAMTTAMLQRLSGNLTAEQIQSVINLLKANKTGPQQNSARKKEAMLRGAQGGGTTAPDVASVLQHAVEMRQQEHSGAAASSSQQSQVAQGQPDSGLPVTNATLQQLANVHKALQQQMSASPGQGHRGQGGGVANQKNIVASLFQTLKGLQQQQRGQQGAAKQQLYLSTYIEHLQTAAARLKQQQQQQQQQHQQQLLQQQQRSFGSGRGVAAGSNFVPPGQQQASSAHSAAAARDLRQQLGNVLRDSSSSGGNSVEALTAFLRNVSSSAAGSQMHAQLHELLMQQRAAAAAAASAEQQQQQPSSPPSGVKEGSSSSGVEGAIPVVEGVEGGLVPVSMSSSNSTTNTAGDSSNIKAAAEQGPTSSSAVGPAVDV